MDSSDCFWHATLRHDSVLLSVSGKFCSLLSRSLLSCSLLSRSLLSCSLLPRSSISVFVYLGEVCFLLFLQWCSGYIENIKYEKSKIKIPKEIKLISIKISVFYFVPFVIRECRSIQSIVNRGFDSIVNTCFISTVSNSSCPHTCKRHLPPSTCSEKNKTLTCNVGQGKLLIRQTQVRAPPGHPLHGRLQAEESTLLHRRGHFRAHARIHHALVHDDGPARPAHARQDTLPVPRVERAQIEELDRHAQVPFRRCDRCRAGIQRSAVGDDGDVVAGLDRLHLRERQAVRFARDLLDSGTVEDLRLEEDDRVRALDRSEQQPLCLAGRAGHHHAQAGDVGEEGFG